MSPRYEVRAASIRQRQLFLPWVVVRVTTGLDDGIPVEFSLPVASFETRESAYADCDTRTSALKAARELALAVAFEAAYRIGHTSYRMGRRGLTGEQKMWLAQARR